jgi:hypothetical protein
LSFLLTSASFQFTVGTVIGKRLWFNGVYRPVPQIMQREFEPRIPASSGFFHAPFAPFRGYSVRGL